jgi:hypothetical protein
MGAPAIPVDAAMDGDPVMRKVGLFTIALAGTLAFATSSAWAFGDVCHGPMSAKGHKEHDRHAAMASAIRHWQHAASHKYGSKFANWYYSGDRTISCSWDAPGRHFTCGATARPCGRR